MAQIKIPNCCLVFATCACAYLRDAKVDARIMTIGHRWPKGAAIQCVCFFQFDGHLHGYDQNGSWLLPRRLTLDSPPKKLAQAFFKSVGSDDKVTAAHWH